MRNCNFYDPGHYDMCMLRDVCAVSDCKGELTRCEYKDRPEVIALAKAQRGILERKVAKDEEELSGFNEAFPAV
jgi:hypothetical protein